LNLASNMAARIYLW